MKIYVIRHGQTGRNKAFLLHGRTDDELNEKGIEQARAAAAFFKDAAIEFGRVYSSPLKRAVSTAKIICGREPEIDGRLIEMDYGPYEGTDLKNLPDELKLFFSDFVNNPAPEGMESLDSVVKRAGEFLEELKSVPETGNILVSTHAIAMKGLLEYLTPESKGSYWSKYIGNCEIYVTELTEGHYTVPVPETVQTSSPGRDE